MSNKENEKPITLLEGRELVLTGESADKFLEALENPRSVEVVDVDRSKGLELLRKRFGAGRLIKKIKENPLLRVFIGCFSC